MSIRRRVMATLALAGITAWTAGCIGDTEIRKDLQHRGGGAVVFRDRLPFLGGDMDHRWPAGQNQSRGPGN